MATPSRFLIGQNTTTLGRWIRLIGGLLLVLYSGLRMISIVDRADALGVGAWFLAILIGYNLAYLVLEKPLLARLNPWLNTLVMDGPWFVILLVPVFPAALQVGMTLYLGATSILNAVIHYGGCEVLAVPTLIFKRRYGVYCPTNVIDLAEQAIRSRKPAAPGSQD